MPVAWRQLIRPGRSLASFEHIPEALLPKIALETKHPHRLPPRSGPRHAAALLDAAPALPLLSPETVIIAVTDEATPVLTAQERENAESLWSDPFDFPGSRPSSDACANGRLRRLRLAPDW